MNGFIQSLKNKTKDKIIFPRTKTKAVTNDAGKDIDTLFKEVGERINSVNTEIDSDINNINSGITTINNEIKTIKTNVSEFYSLLDEKENARDHYASIRDIENKMGDQVTFSLSGTTLTINTK